MGRAGDILRYARESLMQKIQPIVSMRLTCLARHLCKYNNLAFSFFYM